MLVHPDGGSAGVRRGSARDWSGVQAPGPDGSAAQPGGVPVRSHRDPGGQGCGQVLNQGAQAVGGSEAHGPAMDRQCAVGADHRELLGPRPGQAARQPVVHHGAKLGTPDREVGGTQVHDVPGPRASAQCPDGHPTTKTASAVQHGNAIHRPRCRGERAGGGDPADPAADDDRRGHAILVPTLRRSVQASTTRAAMPSSPWRIHARGSYCFLLPTSPSILSTPA